MDNAMANIIDNAQEKSEENVKTGVDVAKTDSLKATEPIDATDATDATVTLKLEPSNLTPEETKRDRVLKKFEKAHEEIIGCAEDKEGFDIYQMCAFLSRHAKFIEKIQEPDTKLSSMSEKKPRISGADTARILAQNVRKDFRVSKLDYYICICKAVAVATLQIWSLVLAIMELISSSDSKVCAGTFEFRSFQHGSSKLVYAGYVALIGMSVLNWVNGVKTSGMYSSLVDDKCIFPDLTDQGWLLAGRTVNYIVLTCSVWSSFLLIYLSDTVLDMILNSIALYFVLELDNMVITYGDYKQVAAYLAVYPWEIETRVDEYIHRSELPAIKEGRECNVFKLLFDVGAWLISAAVVTPIIYFTAFVSFFVAPGFFLWCL